MIETHTLKATLNLGVLVEKDLGAPVKQSGAWRLYFCPFHPNTHTPALGVNTRTGTYKCFSCQEHGDAITWWMRRHNVDFKTALSQLAAQPGGQAGAAIPLSLPPPPPEPAAPPAAWQVRGYAFLKYAQDQLLRNAGEPGLLELTRRGLQVKTLLRWGIGYNPDWIQDQPERWGLTGRSEPFWIPRGVVIPCFAEDQLWYIKVRVFGDDQRPVGKDSQHSKYMQLTGGAAALFGAAYLAGRAGLVLAEAELDALLAWQEGSDLLDVVTLGGAGKRLSPRWLPTLLPYRKIFVAYDQDAAGKAGASKLAALSARLEDWPPPFGDLTDFYIAGGNLRGMLESMWETL